MYKCICLFIYFGVQLFFFTRLRLSSVMVNLNRRCSCIVHSDYDDPSTTVGSFSFDLWVTDNRIRSPSLPFLAQFFRPPCQSSTVCAFLRGCTITSWSYVNKFFSSFVLLAGKVRRLRADLTMLSIFFIKTDQFTLYN